MLTTLRHDLTWRHLQVLTCLAQRREDNGELTPVNATKFCGIVMRNADSPSDVVQIQLSDFVSGESRSEVPEATVWRMLPGAEVPGAAEWRMLPGAEVPGAEVPGAVPRPGHVATSLRLIYDLVIG